MLLSRARDEEVNLHRATDPRTIARLFAEPYFDWTQRGQAAFLSTSVHSSPAIRLQDLEDALNGSNHDSLRSRGVDALLVPGVDGDVAGLYLLDPQLQKRLRRALHNAVTQRTAEWRQVTEADFARLLAHGPTDA